MTEIVERSLILVVGTDADCQSAFTQVAGLLGAALPKTQRAYSADYLAAGFGESHPISVVNDHLLQGMGYAWDDWREVPEGLPAGSNLAEWREELRQVFAAEYGDRGLVVLNDPRLCPVMPFLLKAAVAMQLSPRVVMSFRDPFEAASLLQRSNGFTHEKGLRLWLRRILQAERASRHSPRAFLTHNRLCSNWRRAMESTARSAAIVWPRDYSAAATTIARALSLEPRHDGQRAWKPSVDLEASCACSWAEEAYSALIALQQDAFDKGACSVLDRIGKDFDAACESIGDVVMPDSRDPLHRQAPGVQSVRDEPVNAGLFAVSRPKMRSGHKAMPAAPAAYPLHKNQCPGLVDFPIAVHRAPEWPPAGKDICLLVGYAPDGQPTPALISLLDQLAAEKVDCHVCLAVNDPALPVDVANLGAAAGIFARENGGYDFAAWASLLQSYPAFWTASRLLFANDSIIPVRGLAEVMARLRNSRADFIALTESYEIDHHTQSYFFALQSEALRSNAIRQFWNNIKVETNKEEVVRNYEVALLGLVRGCGGLEAEILFSYERLFPGASLEAPLTGNPTHHLWERLLMTGFPFVKAELLYRNPARLWIEHWEVVLQSLGHDTDLVRAHLTEMHRTRPFPRKRPSMFKARLYELASFFVSNQSVQEMREWNHRRIRARRAKCQEAQTGVRAAR